MARVQDRDPHCLPKKYRSYNQSTQQKNSTDRHKNEKDDMRIGRGFWSFPVDVVVVCAHTSRLGKRLLLFFYLLIYTKTKVLAKET